MLTTALWECRCYYYLHPFRPLQVSLLYQGHAPTFVGCLRTSALNHPIVSQEMACANHVYQNYFALVGWLSG